MTHKLLTLCLLAGLAFAQSFNSGSTGADGPLTYTTPGTVIFDPAALGLNPAGDNVFNFTTINIGPGVTLKLLNGLLRDKPVVWLASGAVTIAGTIDLSGQAGAGIDDPVRANRRPADPGPGGYPGGISAQFTQGLVSTAGFGPGFGFMQFSGIQGGGASYGTAGNGFNGGGTYGNIVLVPLLGGSGGGGGRQGFGVAGGGGGGGGGALRIESSVSITLSGTIAANGGAGGIGGPTESNTGGGGSGGAIHLIAASITGAGSLSAQGGAGGNSIGAGGLGRIRLDAFSQGFTGTSNPTPTLGPSYAVPAPSAQPTVRVTSIGGIAVPPNPTGSFVTPDVVLSNPNPVTVNIQASNVPLGTQATLYLFSEISTDVTLQSTALAGTLANSTAVVQVTFQPGFTSGFVRATW